MRREKEGKRERMKERRIEREKERKRERGKHLTGYQSVYKVKRTRKNLEECCRHNFYSFYRVHNSIINFPGYLSVNIRQ